MSLSASEQYILEKVWNGPLKKTYCRWLQPTVKKQFDNGFSQNGYLG
jgi:hypothetical protein